MRGSSNVQYFLLSIFFLTACSSFQQSKVSGGAEFALPKDLETKFTVKDTKATNTVASVAPVPKVEAPVTMEKQKTKQKKNKSAKAPSPVEWPNRWSIAPMFHEGERYVFDITYFGAVAGELELTTLPAKFIEDRKVFHIKAAARTASIFSLFYRLNDVAESYIDADALFSYRFEMKLDESMQERDILELYDQKMHNVYYYSNWDRKKKGIIKEQFTAAVEPFTQDSLSAFFFVRTLPLEIGKSYRFPVSTNGKMKTVQVTAIRKESLATKKGEFPAIVVKPEVVLDGALQNNGDTYIWYSDDANRSILKIDAKIKVGSVIAYLRELDDGTEKKAAPTAQP